MKKDNFVKQTIQKLDDDNFKHLRDKIVNDKYLKFTSVKKEAVTKNMLAEKFIDYVEKVQIKTDKNFDKNTKAFVNKLIEVVSKNVKNKSRANKYLQLAITTSNKNVLNFKEFTKATNILLCLYAEIIKNKKKPISNFDLKSTSINADKLISSLKKEEKPNVDIPLKVDVIFIKFDPKKDLGSQKIFNDKNILSEDRLAFILMYLLYYYFKNNELEEI